MGAQTTNFFENALHLEFGLQTLQSAIDGLTFTDLDFGHRQFLDGVKRKGSPK